MADQRWRMKCETSLKLRNDACLRQEFLVLLRLQRDLYVKVSFSFPVTFPPSDAVEIYKIE
eukprot:752047-Hanusia_phi.AAC.1